MLYFFHLSWFYCAMGICDILPMQLKSITIIQREREKKLRREGGGEVNYGGIDKPITERWEGYRN